MESEWCDMYDEIDDYVGRSLKNWAARQRPSVDGRQRLLQAAAKSVPPRQNKIVEFLSSLITPSDPYERFIYPQSEWEFGPAFTSMIRSLNLATCWRLVN